MPATVARVVYRGIANPHRLAVTHAKGAHQRQPICIEETGQCGECDVNNPCADGSADRTIAAAQPVNQHASSMQTAGCATGCLFCVEGRCVGCLQQTDCPPRFSCDTSTFTCVSDPCAGLSCQAGTSCDGASGRCVKPDGSPGCNSPSDCAADQFV